MQDHTSVSFISPTKLQTINWPKPSDSSADDTLVKSGNRTADGDGDGLAKIHFESRPPIRARLVIGADGSRSRVRSLAHLRTVGWPYHQRGVIATVDLASPSITAWQRFLPSGPLALLPLGDRFSNVVWSTTEEHALKLQSMTPEEFAHAVNEAFSKEFPAPGFSQEGLKLPSVLRSAASVAGAGAGAAAAAAAAASGAVSSAAAAAGKSLISAIASAASLESLVTQSPINPFYRSSASDKFHMPPAVLSAQSKVLSFPLSLQHAGSYVAPRCVLVGDAAHTVHPLAGQGANLGFGDVTALVTVLEKLVEVGEDIGEVQLLRSYERERLGANIAMMGAMDSLKRVFATNTFPLANARSLGLSILNASPLAKEKFAAFASGTIL
ncbi:unnamed protein product [Closterium sp. Yama58-4]|nr:unnamed protein product [Closterium sp. Yama58-4]